MSQKYSLLALFGAIAGTALAGIAPAAAHHSYAMFDRTKMLTLQGTVRTWEMGNPHAYLWVYVPGADGKQVLWGLEGPGPAVLIKNGWSKYTVKPGDKVTVSVQPLKDGRNGGSLAKLVLADGRSFGNGVGHVARSGSTDAAAAADNADAQ